MKKEIKKYFKQNPGLKVKPRELARKLNLLQGEEYASLKQILYKLSKQGYLSRQGKRYFLAQQFEKEITGVFHLSREGTYGFVIVSDLFEKDIFIPAKHFNTAIHGDTVKVELLAKQRGKNIEGRITGILERKHEQIIGDLVKRKAAYFVFPDEREIQTDIYIPKEYLNGAVNGDKVVVSDILWESNSLNPEGKIIEVLGKTGTREVEQKLIMKQFSLPHDFPKAVLREAETISDKIPANEISNRLDLRSVNTFTIDPEDARDFDDAVSVRKIENGKYEVGIHIADVSHFVNKGSAIYTEALNRATSVYLVGNVVPMLPEKLSNNVCSLVPKEDRLTYSVIVTLAENGRVLNYKIAKSIINSKRRFTYEDAQQILDTGKGDFSKDLLLLNKLAKILREKRISKGSINFIRPEVKFELSDSGEPLNIVLKKIQESNNLIEEFMLLANQIVAKHIDKISSKDILPFVYRIHDEPEEEKIQEFKRFVGSLGYSFNPRIKNKSVELQRILDEAKGSVEEAVVNEIAIRSMAKAMYSTNNIGHYGLGFKFYSHFTSPIRRLPDLIVHKLLYYYLENGSSESYSVKELEDICNQSSNQERNAISAERLSVKLKQIEYLKNKIGSEFEGIISGVANFGIFIQISENLAEGLIRLRDMEDDYYIFDESHYSIIGKDTGQVYRLGDRVNVKLIRVEEDKQEVDFTLI